MFEDGWLGEGQSEVNESEDDRSDFQVRVTITSGSFGYDVRASLRDHFVDLRSEGRKLKASIGLA